MNGYRPQHDEVMEWKMHSSHDAAAEVEVKGLNCIQPPCSSLQQSNGTNKPSSLLCEGHSGDLGRKIFPIHNFKSKTKCLNRHGDSDRANYMMS